MTEKQRRLAQGLAVGCLPALWIWGFLNGLLDAFAGRPSATLVLRLADQNLVSSDGYAAALWFKGYEGHWLLNVLGDPFVSDSLKMLSSTLLLIIPLNVIYVIERRFHGWTKHLVHSSVLAVVMYFLMVALVDPNFDSVRSYFGS